MRGHGLFSIHLKDNSFPTDRNPRTGPTPQGTFQDLFTESYPWGITPSSSPTVIRIPQGGGQSSDPKGCLIWHAVRVMFLCSAGSFLRPLAEEVEAQEDGSIRPNRRKYLSFRRSLLLLYWSALSLCCKDSPR